MSPADTNDAGSVTPPEQPARSRAPTIQSVSRAVRVLLAVVAAPDGMAAKEVSTAFGLTLPTTYHLLTTLVEEGVLAKDQQRRYTVGPKAAIIADAVAAHGATPERYLRLLRRLAADTGETTYLTAWRRGEIAVLATVEGAHAVRVGEVPTGHYRDPHARATGKLLLAFAREEVREEMLREHELRPVTPHTLTTREALEEAFEEVRRTGVSYDVEEFLPGVACVSAPVTEQGATVATLTVSAPLHRFQERRDEYTRAAIAAAREASEHQ